MTAATGVQSGTAHRLGAEGFEAGGVNVSLFFIDNRPGEGPSLHRHPCHEIFIVLEGQSTFTAGSVLLDASAGQIVVVPPGVAHKFVNSGTGRVRQIDIHASPKFITEWLEYRSCSQGLALDY